MDVEIKKFNLKHKQGILQLHRRTFKKNKSSKYWNWRFSSKFLKKPFGLIAFSNKKIISNFIAQPIKYKIKNEEKNCLVTLWTMTDHNYFRKNIDLLHNMMKDTYELAKKKEFFLVIGFANKKSHLIFTRWFGYKETKMNELVIILPINNNSKKILDCIQIKKFDATFTNFYKNHKMLKNKICVPRTSKYLNWRYIEKPGNEYRCYKILKEKKLVGYFILKNYLGEKCHIIDFLVSNDKDVYNTIIDKAIKFALDYNIKEISLWVPKYTSFYKHLKKNNFKEKEIETYFIIKKLNDKSDQYIKKFKNWYITMGDSDVF
jgi:hypothetical protein